MGKRGALRRGGEEGARAAKLPRLEGAQRHKGKLVRRDFLGASRAARNESYRAFLEGQLVKLRPRCCPLFAVPVTPLFP